VLATALLLGGCPAPGLTQNPPDTPEDGAPVVSYCYAPVATDRETEIRPLAEEACAAAVTGAVDTVYWRRSYFLNECPLLKKVRVSYVCRPVPAAAPAPPDDPG